MNTKKNILKELNHIKSSTEFRDLSLLHKKITMIDKKLFTKNLKITSSKLANILSTSQSTVSRVRISKKKDRTLGKRGRPEKLKENQKNQLISIIKEKLLFGEAISLEDVIDDAVLIITKRKTKKIQKENEKKNFFFSKKWAKRFIVKNGFKLIKQSKIDSERLSLHIQEIDDYLMRLGKLFQQNNYNKSFIFNMDETMISLTETDNLRKLVVEKGTSIAIKKNFCKKKHITMISTISADGDFFKCLILLPRKTLEKKIFIDSDN